jgi:hypothetical protein
MEIVMGRTCPTYVEQVRQLTEKWSKFRRCLRREDQVEFDRLLRSVRYYSPSSTYQCSDDPREPVVLSILLDLQKRLAQIEAKLKMPDVAGENPAQLSLTENGES